MSPTRPAPASKPTATQLQESRRDLRNGRSCGIARPRRCRACEARSGYRLQRVGRLAGTRASAAPPSTRMARCWWRLARRTWAPDAHRHHASGGPKPWGSRWAPSNWPSASSELPPDSASGRLHHRGRRFVLDAQRRPSTALAKLFRSRGGASAALKSAARSKRIA